MGRVTEQLLSGDIGGEEQRRKKKSVVDDLLDGNISARGEKTDWIIETFDRDEQGSLASGVSGGDWINRTFDEGTKPVKASIGGRPEQAYTLHTGIEPTGEFREDSNIVPGTTRAGIPVRREPQPVGRMVPTGAPKTAGFGTLVESGFVDNPETKMNILSKRMGIPRDRFGIVDGGIVYLADDGHLYPAEPQGRMGALKSLGADVIAHAPEEIMAAGLAPTFGPGGAALGAAGGAGIRKVLGSLAYNEPQSSLGNLGRMGLAAGAGVLGERVGAGGIRAIDRARGGKQAARLVRAAGRSRDRINLPEVKEISALGKKHGIDLVPPQTTKSPELISRFNILGDLPETADKIGGIRKEQFEQVSSAIGNYLDSLAPESSAYEAGEAAQKAAAGAVKGTKAVRANKARPYYDKAFQAGVEVDTSNALHELDNLLGKTVKGDPSYAALTRIRKMINEAGGDLEKLDRVKRRGIDAVLQKSKADPTLKREMAEVKDALVESMDTVSPDYARARRIFSEESGAVEELAGKKRTIGRLAGLEGDDVEKAARLVFTSSPQVAKRAKQVITKHGGKEAWDKLIRAHMQNALDSIKETAGGSGVYNLGGRFRQKLFGDPAQRKIMQEVMDPTQFKNFDDFMKVLDRSGLILGRESTTATRQVQLRQMRMDSRIPYASSMMETAAQPLRTPWRVAVEKIHENLFRKYNERLADAMASEKASRDLQAMLRLKPRSIELIKRLSTFLGSAGGGDYSRDLEQAAWRDRRPETLGRLVPPGR